jgi:hypothetical protein
VWSQPPALHLCDAAQPAPEHQPHKQQQLQRQSNEQAAAVATSFRHHLRLGIWNKWGCGGVADGTPGRKITGGYGGWRNCTLAPLRVEVITPTDGTRLSGDDAFEMVEHQDGPGQLHVRRRSDEEWVSKL